MKLSLAKTWKECLRMWKWVVENNYRFNSVHDAKRKWLMENHYGDSIHANCFFCHYDENHCTELECCIHCPGILMDKQFHCENKTYNYEAKPKKFYAKLLELNKKRIERKRNDRRTKRSN